MMPFAEAQTVLQQQLAEHGSCSPLELLLETSRLDYDDYHAWRRGERETLDDTLVEGPGSAHALMGHVEDWARMLNLEPQTITLYGIENHAGTELRASKDPRLDDFLHTEFLPAASRAQLDLFLDTEGLAAANDLAAALASRDVKAAEARLARLVEINPHHLAVADANTLIEALQAAPPCARDATKRLAELEGRWLPAASAVLHAGARDFLTPMWRELGAALEGKPFDEKQPHRHAAWALLQRLGLAERATQRLRHRPSQRQPQLLGWLAEAQWRLAGPQRGAGELVHVVLARTGLLHGADRRTVSGRGVEELLAHSHGRRRRPADHCTLVPGLDGSAGTGHGAGRQDIRREERPGTRVQRTHRLGHRRQRSSRPWTTAERCNPCIPACSISIWTR